MGVSISTSVNEDRTIEKKSRSRSSTPRRQASFHVGKDDGGGVNGDDSCREKYASRSLPPSRRRGTGPLLEDEGDDVDDRAVGGLETKNLVSESQTPAPARIVPSAQR